MAGSLRKFDYTSDDGNDYQILRDESNTETVNGTNVAATAQYSLPDGYTPRYALMYQVSNPQIKRKVAVLDPAVFGALLGGTDYSLAVVGATPANFRISSLIGERREQLVSSDTGQTDGDSPN
jgi:hypothetical protein